MGGVFGGYLFLVNGVGGAVLHVLVGGKSWKESDAGRNLRLITGAIVLGAVLGMIVGSLPRYLTDYAWKPCPRRGSYADS